MWARAADGLLRASVRPRHLRRPLPCARGDGVQRAGDAGRGGVEGPPEVTPLLLPRQ